MKFAENPFEELDCVEFFFFAGEFLEPSNVLVRYEAIEPEEVGGSIRYFSTTAFENKGGPEEFFFVINSKKKTKKRFSFFKLTRNHFGAQLC